MTGAEARERVERGGAPLVFDGSEALLELSRVEPPLAGRRAQVVVGSRHFLAAFRDRLVFSLVTDVVASLLAIALRGRDVANVAFVAGGADAE